MIELGLKFTLAYLLGSVLGSIVVGYFKGGVDIRKVGSGNAGGTNALRTQGKWFALWVMIIDIGKGILAASSSRRWSLPGVGIDPDIDRSLVLYAVAFAAIVGHVFPVWFGFRGGKGGATAAVCFAISRPSRRCRCSPRGSRSCLLDGLRRSRDDQRCACGRRVHRHHAAARTSSGLFCSAVRRRRCSDLHASRQHQAHARTAPSRGSDAARGPLAAPRQVARVTAERLLRALADGEPHSGEDLARAFGVTRAAVWKQVGKLAQWGLTSKPRRASATGWRVRSILLDTQALRSQRSRPDVAARHRASSRCSPSSRRRIAPARAAAAAVGQLDVVHRRVPDRGARPARAQLAHAARRGHVPVGRLAVRRCPPSFAALTLAVGVVVRRVVARVAGVEIALKWPNDLVWDERKLGGILLELKSEGAGRLHVVAGIGLNVALPSEAACRRSATGRAARSILRPRSAEPPPRAVLAAALVGELAELFTDYPSERLRRVSRRLALGRLLARPFRARSTTRRRCLGTALGIDVDGAC